MSMRPRVSVEVPAQTVAVVRAACPGGTRVTRVRDALGPIFDDGHFQGWFSAEGRGYKVYLSETCDTDTPHLIVHVETTQTTRAHHLRHCRYTGLAKTRVQHVLTACGVNAARIADWTQRDNQPAPTRPPPPFKILCQQLTTS